jgi:hypothetical protein
MAHTISERQIRMFWRRVGQEELRRTEPQRRRATIEAKIAVAAFNVRARSAHPVLAWPTFRAAVLSERPFLMVECVSCGQIACVDLRKIGYHLDASINALTPYLKCMRCQPDPPSPRLFGLRKCRL